ncbi:Radical SAM domain protein, partial [Candidatus Magnetomorum sp. HK-1]
AAPYPGTEFYEYAKEKGYLRIDKYEEFDQNASAVVEYPTLSRNQIKAAARRATIKFYLRPKQIIRLLKEMKDISVLKAILLIIRDQYRLLSKGKRMRKDATKKMHQ